MSGPMHGAVTRLEPELKGLLTTIEVKRRPSAVVAAWVAQHLADRYRDTRGYVDETVEQIVKTSPGLTDSLVRACLDALDALGIWCRVEGRRGGSPRSGTRRVPGPRLVDGEASVPVLAARSGTAPTSAGLTTDLRGVDHRPPRGGPPTSAGWTTDLRGVDPATPLTTPYIHNNDNHESSSSRSARVEQCIEAGARRYALQKPHVRDLKPYARRCTELFTHRSLVEQWVTDGHPDEEIVSRVIDLLLGREPKRFNDEVHEDIEALAQRFGVSIDPDDLDESISELQLQALGVFDRQRQTLGSPFDYRHLVDGGGA